MYTAADIARFWAKVDKSGDCWNWLASQLCVRVSHLRLVTRAVNAQNLSGAHLDSCSGVRGVDWHAPSGRWRVRVRANRRDYHGGYFDNLADAAAKASELRKSLHG